jgi:hypothetical protein
MAKTVPPKGIGQDGGRIFRLILPNSFNLANTINRYQAVSWEAFARSLDLPMKIDPIG